MHQLNDCILPYFLASLLLFVGLFFPFPMPYCNAMNEGVQNDAVAIGVGRVLQHT